MAYDESLRILVNSHYLQGKKCPEIYHALAKSVPKQTIQRWIQLFINKNQVVAIKSRGRPPTFDKTEHRKSIRKLALDFDCDKRTMSRIFYKDLGLKKYTPTVVPRLTDAQKKKRLACARWWRKNFNQLSSRKVMFSDEK